MTAHRFATFNSVLLGAAYCVFAAIANGQTAPPNRGVLLRQQAPTLLQSAAANDCSVGALQLRIRTGSDDLRGGNNNLNVQIHFADGSMQAANNVNKNANWPNNSINIVQVPLTKRVSPSQIKSITLVHLAQAGNGTTAGTFHAALAAGGPPAAGVAMLAGVQSEDNWDMAEFQANALGNGSVSVPIASSGDHVFTGSNPSLDIPSRPNATCPSAGQVTALEFSFNTGNDDLRGGNDNVNIVLNFADGSRQVEFNANHSQTWTNGSNHQLSVVLNRPVTLNQIRSVTLETTFGGGSGGDNWNMDSVSISAFVNGKINPVMTSGFHRFSADLTGPKAKTFTIALK
jgi:hypothetical protein